MCRVWTLTTYDACDIRCSYCASYAQGPSTPRATADEVRSILERALASIPRDQPICLGAIIDCYTHAEAEHEVTRAALEVLIADGRDLIIVTKGTLIERDLDLLAGYDKVSVNVSLPSLDEAVLDDIEPQADSGAARFATIERLAEAGVDVQLHVQPWIPGMTDGKQMVEAAAGRFKVWIAPLNIQNPVIARSRWGKRFTQQEINEAYVAEMKRVGPHENLTWARPLWLGDDLLTQSQWGVELADCALEQRIGLDGDDPDDPLRRPPLAIRGGDTPDRAVIEARDVATTGEIIEALVTGPDGHGGDGQALRPPAHLRGSLPRAPDRHRRRPPGRPPRPDRRLPGTRPPGDGAAGRGPGGRRLLHHHRRAPHPVPELRARGTAGRDGRRHLPVRHLRPAHRAVDPDRSAASGRRRAWPRPSPPARPEPASAATPRLVPRPGRWRAGRRPRRRVPDGARPR